jgi:Xaa-Pro aminopeptidase
MIAARLTQLRAKMREMDVDTFMVTLPENRRYISGFTGSAGWVFITQTAQKIASDFRYYEQIKQQCPDFTLIEVRGKFEAMLTQVLAELGARRVAVESDDLTYDTYRAYEAVLPAGITFVPTKDILREQRAVKDAGELAAIEKAVELTDRAITTVRQMLRPGMTEKELAWKLEAEMRQSGAGRISFDLIVAAGPASAMPHAKPSDRPIRAGEPIVIDMGCTWDGYCSDLTRTLIIGEPDVQFRAIYDTVLRAQQNAEAQIKAGIDGKQADAFARQVIADAGYGDKFGHGTGHGVGLAIHELPVLSMLSEHVLKPGHVVTVEPGIYLPEWGGVRIEDMVVVGEAGVTILTAASKDPVVPLR